MDFGREKENNLTGFTSYDKEDLVLCYRCGELFNDPPEHTMDGQICYCPECGELGAMELATIVDLLNNLHLKGALDEVLEHYIIYDDPDDCEELNFE